MSNKSKNKGDREERDVVNLHRELGLDAQRTLESGARSDGTPTWDIDIITPIGPLKGECKLRSKGFKQIYDWLVDDFLTIRADRQERLYVVKESFWLKIMENLKNISLHDKKEKVESTND